METKKNNSKKSVDLKDHQDVTFLCGSFLLSVIFLLMILSPLYQKKLALDEAYAAKEEDLQSKQELLQNIEAFNEENKDLTVNSEKLALLIPNRNNYEDFLIHIQQMTRSFNLEMLKFSLKEIQAPTVTVAETTTSTGAVITPETTVTTETAEEALKQQGVDIALRGDYASFVNFTRALENGTPFLQEDSFKVSADKAGAAPGEGQPANTNPMLNFDLNLRFIHY